MVLFNEQVVQGTVHRNPFIYIRERFSPFHLLCFQALNLIGTLTEAANKSSTSGPTMKGGGGKGWTTKEKNFFKL